MECVGGDAHIARRLAQGQQFSSAAASKPSGGIRSLHSLSAWGLPTPVVALACTCSVDIQVFFLCKWGNFISYGVCKLVLLGSPLGDLSPQVTEGLLSTAANRFHKELRFFFSLLKRKKEAKKEKSSRFTCTVRFKYHAKITQEILINKTPPAGHTGGLSAVTLPVSHLKLGRKVSGDPPLLY